ncbi:MAG TPA: rhodanese-like domain-containing protein [Casimicrobiaceae bacterium]|nr:rhodanese-like domain-containing protein [Casimicrobiaceae bacterium]
MRMLIGCVVLALAPAVPALESQNLANPAIDSAGYLRLANEAAQHREAHRVSEAEFIRLAKQPGTVVLDARSRVKYDALHVRGAVNLSFPDLTVESLAATVPDKSTVILIYCNNNFRDAPDPFPSKLPPAALNLATYTTLYTYGYRNVYELGPLLEVATTRIEFEPRLR